MKVYSNATTRKISRPRNEKSKQDRRPHSRKNTIYKKFVNWQILSLVFILGIVFISFFTSLMIEKNIFVIFLVNILTFFFVWNKLYQMIYDLKILFFFNGKYGLDTSPLQCEDYPTISFVVPSFHEPFHVVKMTLDSIIETPYKGKKEIIVVDNSTNTLSKDFLLLKDYVQELEAVYSIRHISTKFIHNCKTDTLKPGNLDLAEQFIEDGEFVVILDVDSTLPKEEKLLENAIAEFLSDNKLGFLQFSMRATNYHFSDLTQSIAFSQDLHRLRLTSRGFGGYKIFEGHNGMWRKIVLEKVGAWTDYYRGNIMITEDILKSALVYSHGYYGKTLNITTGEWVPNSLNALESMWMRWTYGTSQVLFKYFRDIYGKTVSMVEKFDITYHVLHHFSQGFIFPTAIVFQVFIPGSVTNAFICFTYLLPQLIGATISLSNSNTICRLKIPFVKKIKYTYSGFFLIDTFIMSTQLNSSINFLLRIPQGWKVTEKGIENSRTRDHSLLNKSFHLMLVGVTFAACGLSWIVHYNMDTSKIIHIVLLGFMNTNLLLCILVFRKIGRKKYNNIESATINHVIR